MVEPFKQACIFGRVVSVARKLPWLQVILASKPAVDVPGSGVMPTAYMLLPHRENKVPIASVKQQYRFMKFDFFIILNIKMIKTCYCTMLYSNLFLSGKNYGGNGRALPYMLSPEVLEIWTVKKIKHVLPCHSSSYRKYAENRQCICSGETIRQKKNFARIASDNPDKVSKKMKTGHPGSVFL
jgi:hypothetical protein